MKKKPSTKKPAPAKSQPVELRVTIVKPVDRSPKDVRYDVKYAIEQIYGHGNVKVQFI